MMIQVQPDFGSGPPVVLHAVLDGHGGEVSLDKTKLFKLPSSCSLKETLYIQMHKVIQGSNEAFKNH